jgi:hypothetical protein
MRHHLPAPLLAALAGTLAACSASQVPTLDDYAGTFVGQDVAVLRNLVRRPDSRARTVGWQERTYTLANGHWVYVEQDRENCEIHYEVDGSDIIVGYTAVGRGCAHQ